ALNAKSEYNGIAQRVTPSVAELQGLLVAVTRGKGAAERFSGKLKELGDWIKKEKERTEADKLRTGSHTLKAEVEEEHLASSNGLVSVQMDLGTLMEAIYREYTNYSTNANYVLKNIDAPMVKDSVAQHLANAEQAAGQLAGLAQQAQSDAQALQLLLDS